MGNYVIAGVGNYVIVNPSNLGNYVIADTYYQWSRAVAGKTVSRRLSEGEAELYRSWITNRRHLEQVVAQMEQISAAAGELLLRQTAPPEPPQSAKH